MSYRNDVDALAARKAALDAEVDARTKERDEAARMLAELHARAKLPVLPNIRIASPCTADWNAMTGDERVRHCASCDKDVFNLSAMTRAEAEALVVEKNANLCARYYQRKDGTILLADCEVGRAQQRRRLELVGAGLFVTITAAPRSARSPIRIRDGARGRGLDRRTARDQDISAIAGDRPIAATSADDGHRRMRQLPRCDLTSSRRCDGLVPRQRNAILDAYTKVQGAFDTGPARRRGTRGARKGMWRSREAD